MRHWLLCVFTVVVVAVAVVSAPAGGSGRFMYVSLPSLIYFYIFILKSRAIAMWWYLAVSLLIDTLRFPTLPTAVVEYIVVVFSAESVWHRGQQLAIWMQNLLAVIAGSAVGILAAALLSVAAGFSLNRDIVLSFMVQAGIGCIAVLIKRFTHSYAHT